ncbi:hypothetical protein ACT47O_004113 [Cronobacter sakazakii]
MTVCTGKSPAARACSRRKRATTPQGASHSARCWTPAGSWRYRWDRTDQIVQQIHTDTTPATPGEKYSQYLWGYDAAGQVTKAVEPQKEERYFWDPAGNRTEEHRNPVWHNLLLRLDGLKLDYDGFGRLTRRQDKRGVVQRFAYDDEQRVKEITFTGHAEFKKVEYRYDPLLCLNIFPKD